MILKPPLILPALFDNTGLKSVISILLPRSTGIEKPFDFDCPAGTLSAVEVLKIILRHIQSNPPAGGEAIGSQFRVWPFLRAAIAAFGERNRNPGRRFAGDYQVMDLLGKSDFRTKF